MVTAEVEGVSLTFRFDSKIRGRTTACNSHSEWAFPNCYSQSFARTMAEKKSKNQTGNGSGKRRLLRRSIGKLLMILAGVFCGLLLCELILRVSGYSNASFYISDPVVGTALRPNAEGWWTKEGHEYIRINSQGLRDHEHTKAKPANTV